MPAAARCLAGGAAKIFPDRRPHGALLTISPARRFGHASARQTVLVWRNSHNQCVLRSMTAVCFDDPAVGKAHRLFSWPHKFFTTISQTFGRRLLSYPVSADCFGETEGRTYEEDRQSYVGSVAYCRARRRGAC